MTNSGTKLVLAILGLAVALGAVSWWYRFESAHRATGFWGPEAAELIAEPSTVLGFELKRAADSPAGEPKGDRITLADQDYETPFRAELTAAPGMVHLRHALLTDSNYLWIKRPTAPDAWRWMLTFSQGDRTVTLLLSDDLNTLGKSVDSSQVEIISSQPMATTLREYFTALGIGKTD